MSVTIALSLAFALIVFGLLLRRLVVRTRQGTYDPLEWLEEFSPTTYRPMQRLLDPQDRAFLASQNGFEPSIGRRLSKERREIFRAYLSGMLSDFHRLLRIASVMTVYASVDQAPFGTTLWRRRLRFYAALSSIRLRLMLNGLGIGSVDVRALVASIERLQVYTENVIPIA